MTISVLVTGGEGFLGSFIVHAALLQHPEWKITVMDTRAPQIEDKHVSCEIGDITSASSVDSILHRVKPNIIIHTAGIVPDLPERYSRRKEARVFDVNVNGTRHLLSTARKYNVQAFVYTSSCTAVTDDLRREYRNIDEHIPTSKDSLIYGESKAMAESFVLEANSNQLATCSLRPCVLFGERDYQLIPSLYACILKNETPWVIGSGDNLWDVAYAGNIADAHILAADNLLSTKTAAGEAIFISNEEPIPFRDLCLAVWANFGHYPSFTFHIPVTIAAFVGLIAEWVSWLTGKPATLSQGSVYDACATRYCSGEKARRILGYKPRVGIEEGLQVSCKDFSRRLDSRKNKIEGGLSPFPSGYQAGPNHLKSRN